MDDAPLAAPPAAVTASVIIAPPPTVPAPASAEPAAVLPPEPVPPAQPSLTSRVQSAVDAHLEEYREKLEQQIVAGIGDLNKATVTVATPTSSTELPSVIKYAVIMLAVIGGGHLIWDLLRLFHVLP